MHIVVIGGDTISDRLEQQRLAGLGRRHNQAALAASDRRYQIDQARREHIRLGLQLDLLIWENRRQLVERRALAGRLGVHAVDQLDAQEREVALALLWRPNLAPDSIA